MMTNRRRVVGMLAVVSALGAATSPGLAICNPGKVSGQYSSVNAPQSTTFDGAIADPSSGALVGRMWTPGGRNFVNEGSATIDAWLFDASPLGLPGQVVYAFWGDERYVGCPAGSLITVLQSPALDGDGAHFVVGKVTEWFGSFMDFDYTRTSTTGVGWVAKPLPPPWVAVDQTPGTRIQNVTVGASRPQGDVSNLFYGEPGMDPSETITGRLLYRFVGPGGPGTTRSPRTSAWTYTGLRAPGASGGGTLFLPPFDCDTAGTGNDIFLAWALEFDGGAVVSDFVGKAVQIVCNSGATCCGHSSEICSGPLCDEFGVGEPCNGVDDNHDGFIPVREFDHDGDGYVECGPWVGSDPGILGGGDCDDNDATTYPGAPQICDVKNNDCSDPSWPAVPADDTDADGDGLGLACDPYPNDPDNLGACMTQLGTCTDDLARCSSDLAAEQASLREGLAGLSEILRLISIPPGRRYSAFSCTGELCPAIQEVIRRLLPPGHVPPISKPATPRPTAVPEVSP